MTEFSQYNALKEAVRAKRTRHPSSKNVADVEKIKKDIRSEVQEGVSKKTDRPRRKFELIFENTRFYLHVIKT